MSAPFVFRTFHAPVALGPLIAIALTRFDRRARVLTGTTRLAAMHSIADIDWP